MQLIGKILLGFFIGSLCGLLPLIYGLLNDFRISAIVGIVMSASTGVLFSIFDKSPFTAMVMAVLVVLVNIAQKKRLSNHDDDSEHDTEHDEI